MQPALTPLEQQQLHVAEAPTATFWHHVRFELVHSIVRRERARRVVDVGAGSGLLGEHLRSSSVEYLFTEASPALHASLVRRFGPRAALADDSTVAADSVVTLLDVIEHVVDDAGLLRDLHARIQPGATLVVTVPAMRWLFSSWDRDLGHHRRYSRRDAAAVVRGAGFRVVEASYLFPELVPLAFVRRWRSSDGTAAEFPRLPGWVERVGRTLGALTTSARRLWPVGTSVLVVARRPEDPR